MIDNNQERRILLNILHIAYLLQLVDESGYRATVRYLYDMPAVRIVEMTHEV